MFNATPFAFSDTLSNCKSAIFPLRTIGKLKFCRFPAIFSFPTVYSYRNGNREHEKKHNDLKSSVSRQKKSAPFRFRGLRKNIATREKRATIKACPKTTYGPGHLLLAFGQFTLSADSFFLSTPKTRCWVLEWFSLWRKNSGSFLLPEFCKGVKHHFCRLQKNQKPRHSPQGSRTLWTGYNALLRNIYKAARYTPTWYIQRPFCDRKQGCFHFRIILFRIVPIVHHPVLSEIINSLYQIADAMAIGQRLIPKK